MAGLIRKEDIAHVRENADLEALVSQHVTLKPAGVGSLKGLCPFHDEKTPSFTVRPAVGMYHCFGCGEGGDAIAFVQKIFSMSFVEAVEYLADKQGFALTYEQGDAPRRTEDVGRRQRLIEANRLAQQFFASQLQSNSPGAQVARDFLVGRAFGPADAEHFGLGYAPDSWDELLRFLRSRSFTETELSAAGLVSQGARGTYDRFRDRLIWPIRDITGATVGFGARKLGDAEGPKYLNTPETAIYKKSQVLYGLDLAKKAITTSKEVIVVEGYTDVMAAHKAGLENAVATCGTAFGEGHAKVLSRLIGVGQDAASSIVLADGHTRGGRVIFTFDGDTAGQKAALRAFREDQRFAAQTYVAVDARGQDPCDIRLERGDEALRGLVNQPQPLFDFVIKNALGNLDLNTVEGRVAGLRAAAPVVAQIRDSAIRSGYERELASWLSMTVKDVREAGRSVHSEGGTQVQRQRSKSTPDALTRKMAQTLACAVQIPGLVDARLFDSIAPETFGSPSLVAVAQLVASCGGVASFAALQKQKGMEAATRAWVAQLLETSAGSVDKTVQWLAAMPLPANDENEQLALASGLVRAAKVIELNAQIAQLRGSLARSGGEGDGDLFRQILQLEQQRRSLTA